MTTQLKGKAGNIHALPEGARAQQNRLLRILKIFQHLAAIGTVALLIDDNPDFGERAFDVVGRVAQRWV